MGISRSEEGTELLYPRAMIPIAGLAAGVIPLDIPYVNFRDEAGLIKDTKISRQLGFKGRFLIHPKQIEPVNKLFSPSPEEIEYAHKVVTSFEEARGRGSASTSVEGRMVGTPVTERAYKLLEQAAAISQKEKLASEGR